MASSSDLLKQHLLESFRPPKGRRLWHGGPTAEGALRGVDAATALWRPTPGRHNIWELALHIAYWRYAVRRLIEKDSPRFPRSPSNWPRLPDTPDEDAWKNDAALLRAEGDAFAAMLERLPPRQLHDTTPGPKKYALIDKVQGVILHDTYHTAQIQMLKKLRHEQAALAPRRRRAAG